MTVIPVTTMEDCEADPKPSLRQRFERLEDGIDKELGSILAAHPTAAEVVARKISSLGCHIQERWKHYGQPVLADKTTNDGQDGDAHAEYAASNIQNDSSSYERDTGCDAHNEPVTLDLLARLTLTVIGILRRVTVITVPGRDLAVVRTDNPTRS